MKINLAVFFGCRSVEHEISIISAVQAMNSMNNEKYNIIPVYVAKNGVMYTGDNMMTIDIFKNEKQLAEECDVINIVRREDGVYVEYCKNGLFSKKKPIRLDICFPIVHGTNCEDGSIQGYFEMLGIPYVGCDVISSSIGMDKVLFKNILQARGIPVLPCIDFYSKDYAENKEMILENILSKIGLPVIVKPANLGSSVGISKAETEDELTEAIDLACSFASKVLVERAVCNLREINCSVLGNSDECRPSALEEPIMHDKILSYDDKYKQNASKSGSKGMASLSRKLPAELPEGKTEEIQNWAVETFKAIGASGVVRIDFLMDVDDGNKVYVNEINTIPGSLSFYLWEATGLKYTDLLDEMISLGFKRDRDRENLMFTINTNILSETSFGSKGSKVGK